MILTLAVTFTLPYLHMFACKQMFEMTRNKEQTNTKHETTKTERKPRMDKYGTWFSEISQQYETLNSKPSQKSKRLKSVFKAPESILGHDFILSPNVYLLSHFRHCILLIMDAM